MGKGTPFPGEQRLYGAFAFGEWEMNVKKKCANKGPLTKEVLIDLYLTQNLTSLQIARALNRSKPTILYWLKQHNIPRRSMSVAKRGRKPNLTLEQRQRWSEKRAGKGNSQYGKFGSDHPAWKPPDQRKVGLYDLIRSSRENTRWRKLVLERDGHSCVLCGSAIKLNVDHIKPFAVIIRENNILRSQDAKHCEELWSLDNGRTLCEKCHKQTESYGRNLKK